MGVTLFGSQGLSSPQANDYVGDVMIPPKKFMKVAAFGVHAVNFLMLLQRLSPAIIRFLIQEVWSWFQDVAVQSSGIVTTSRYVVPTGRVKVPAGRYVVPTGKDNVIVSAGRSKVIPAGLKIYLGLDLQEILTFIRELGYSGNIKLLSDVKVEMLSQPWRTFRTIINKCLSAPEASSGKRLKATAKVTKSGKKKQPAKGLETLSKVALNEAVQIKIALERIKTQQHSSHASGSGADEGTGKSSDEEDDDDEANIGKDEDDDDQDNDDDQGDEDERINLDNDGDDFVHPKFSTHGEEDKEEDSFDPTVQTPSHVESTDDEDSDEEFQGANVEGDEQDEEGTNEEVKANELYRGVNVNLVGRDTKMMNALRTIIQTTQVIEDTHVIITPVNPEGQQQSSSVSSGFVSNMLNPSLDTGLDSVFNLNTESTSLIDILVTTIAEPPLLSAITFPPPPTPLITHLLKTLENDFLEFKQTNQFAAVSSSIPIIIDTYLASKMSEAVKTAVQLQSDRLRDKAQAENEDFINKLDDNIKKIIKDQVKKQVKAHVSKILLKIEKTVNEQLEEKVLTRSSNESKTSHAVAANLSELELKKILIDNIESNKSIHRSDEQKNLYKALVNAYESEKLILDTYGETFSFKRHQDKEDKDEEPSAGSNRGLLIPMNRSVTPYLDVRFSILG
ncbi:hypothetical protein Tco_0232241 [Tanacetum coccineum]